MVKIDLKDRKILYQLDMDSRQSSTQIGKKVKLSKAVVNYRINRLIDNGVIENFYTAIDAYKLGYIGFRIYLILQYHTPTIRKKMIDYFIKQDNIWRLASIKGMYDFVITIWIKDIMDFYKFWDRALEKFGYYFSEYIFSVYIRGTSYRFSYLLQDEFNRNERIVNVVNCGGKKITIDNFDFQLLNSIARDARSPLTSIAKELGCSSKMIKYRIKNLIKSGIIQAFRTTIDISKLGLSSYKVDVFFREHNKIKEIRKYIKHNPHLVHIGTSTGISELDLIFHLPNSDKLHEIMEEIMIKYPGVIRNYQYITALKFHKSNYMPNK